MARYDGEIKINAKIDTQNASSQMMSLQNRIAKTAQKIDEITKSMKELEVPNIKTAAFKSLEADLAKAQEELNEYIAKEQELSGMGLDFGAGWNEVIAKEAMASDKIDSIKAKMESLKASGQAFSDSTNTAKYSKLNNDLKNANNEMSYLNKKQDELKAKQSKVDAQSKKTFGSMIGRLKKTGKEIDKTSKKTSNMGGMIKNMLISMALFSAVFKGFQYLGSGLQNMVVYSSDFNKAVSQMLSSTSQLKNALATAFAPIITIAAPYISALIDKISEAATAVSRFFAILGGKSTYTKAIKQNKDYASSLIDASKAADEAQGSLAGFDDLDVLQKQSTGTDSGSSSSDTPDGSGFTEVAIDSASIESFEKLKAAMEPTIEALGRLKDALGPLKKFAAKGLQDFYNDFLVPVGNWVLGEGLSGFIDGITTLVTTIDWDKLNTALDNLWKALAPFAINVGQGLLWFWQNVLVPLASWTISNVLPAFLNILSGALSVINSVIEDAKPFLQWLWENFLKPIAEWTGGVIVDVLNGIGDALKWISENEVAISIIEGFAFAIGLVSIALAIFDIVGGIASGVLTALGIAFDFITGPVGIVILIIGALITVGILLYKNWDTIKEKAKEIWEWIKNDVTTRIKLIMLVITTVMNAIKKVWNDVWGAIKKFVSDTWDDIKRKVSDAFDKIKNKISNTITAIQTTWNSIWGAISGKVTTIWTDMKTAVTTKVNDIKKGISTALNTIQTKWNNIWGALSTTVSTIWSDIWTNIKGVINKILGGIEKMANGVVDGINTIIRALNNLKFTIPDWVPGDLGGKTLGFNINTLGSVSIPRLANGGITTGSTIANIGEAGREAVLPLENNTEWMQELADVINSSRSYQPGKAVMQVEGKVFAELMLPYMDQANKRIGTRLVRQ